MAYFLAKSEPSVYSIDQLRKDRTTVWDGVTNPQAVKTIASMKCGDRVFFYHSGGVSAVVGLMEVVGGGRPDPANPKSAVMEVGYLAHLDPPVTLKEIKESGLFDDWALVRQSRLSTMPAPDSFVRWMRQKFPGTRI